MNKSDCIFCKISQGEIPSERIYENDNFFSIYDVNPKAEGHALVISKRHYENILELPASLGGEFLDCVKKTVEILLKKHDAEGFNIIGNNFSAAGQIVMHLHIHILPRKKNDNIKMIV